MMDKNTNLLNLKDWETPYNHFRKGEYSTVEYWASKVGQDVELFISDLNGGLLDDWFKIYDNEEEKPESELNDLLKKCWIASRYFIKNYSDKNFNDFLSRHEDEIFSYFKKKE